MKKTAAAESFSYQTIEVNSNVQTSHQLPVTAQPKPNINNPYSPEKEVRTLKAIHEFPAKLVA